MPRKPSVIRNADDVYNAFLNMAFYKEERVYAILLDGESVMGIEKVSSGWALSVDVWPDTIYRPALERDCKSIIVVHNHPTRIPYPSKGDRKESRNLFRWGRRIGIDMQDSVIIALGGYYSFEESGALRGWRKEK